MKKLFQLLKEYLWLNCSTVISLFGAVIVTAIVVPFVIGVLALAVAACAVVGAISIVLLVAGVAYFTFTATNNFFFNRLCSF